MLRKALIGLFVLAVLFLVAPGAASPFVFAQGTPQQSPQDVINAVSPILIGVIFGLIGGTLVGAPVIALFILRGMLNSPVVIQFLKHLADSLSPEWQQVLRASGTLIDDISGNVATLQPGIPSVQPGQILQPYQPGFGQPSTVPPSGGPGVLTGTTGTPINANPPPGFVAQIPQQ